MAPRASRSRAQTVPLVPAAASSQSALLGMIPPYIVSTSTTMDPRVDDVDLSMLNYVPMLQSREEQQSADHGTASTLSARPLDYFFLRASAEASANDDVSEIWQMDGYFGGWNQQQQHLDSEHSMNTDTCGDSAGMSVTTTTSRSASPPRDRTQSAASSSAVTVTSQVSVESVAKIAESIEAVRREKRWDNGTRAQV